MAILKECDAKTALKHIPRTIQREYTFNRFYISEAYHNFTIVCCEETNKWYASNIPAILTVREEEEVFTMTGVKLDTMCRSDVEAVMLGAKESSDRTALFYGGAGALAAVLSVLVYIKWA